MVNYKELKVGDVLEYLGGDESATDEELTVGKTYEVVELQGSFPVIYNDDEAHWYVSGYNQRCFRYASEKEPTTEPYYRIGQRVKVINAEPTKADEESGRCYYNGDVFEVGRLWSGGITTTQGVDMFFREIAPFVEDAPQGIVEFNAVSHPSHYTRGKFETIEIIEEITQGYEDGYVAYCVGNSIKYLARAPFKHESPTEDIRKAIQYLQFALERIEKE